MDSQKLDTFMQKIVGDLGAAFSIAPVRIGGALGIYGAMAELGATSSARLATSMGLAERYVREWLWHQAASGYVEYDANTGQFTLPPEHAFVLADPQSPAHVLPGFAAAVALSDNMPTVMRAFRTGEGVPWGEQSGCIACAIAEFFRPGYRANLVESWLPALDGVVERLRAGALVADIGCGHGHTTRLMAKAFPASRFTGVDFHAPSIEAACRHAATNGKIDNLKFEVGSAQDFDGTGLDLVTCFDCLHDMGDPVTAARRIRTSLRPGGSWMIVEPFAQDEPERNFTPIGRMSYAASTMTCVPGALAQKGGFALGAQAGERRLREVLNQAGFSNIRRVAETPLNLVLEARP
jgi:2-polyprenyl-3-methyl-5-hydroxy-6-metoxy-1,4-benzoquinol methylase